jgi:prepilin-type N-terminal cleavage/methylation domain-containing protein
MTLQTGANNTNALNIRSLRGREAPEAIPPSEIASPSARNDRGFTLVEVMISVLILGVGLAIIAHSYLAGLRGINSTQNNIQAMLLAREKLDALEIESLQKDGLSAVSTKSTFQSAGKKYDYTLNIVDVGQPEYIAKYLVQACVTLSWQEQNATKNAGFSTYFPRQKD